MGRMERLWRDSCLPPSNPRERVIDGRMSISGIWSCNFASDYPNRSSGSHLPLATIALVSLALIPRHSSPNAIAAWRTDPSPAVLRRSRMGMSPKEEMKWREVSLVFVGGSKEQAISQRKAMREQLTDSRAAICTPQYNSVWQRRPQTMSILHIFTETVPSYQGVCARRTLGPKCTRIMCA